MTRGWRRAVSAAAILSTVGCDQVTKRLAVDHLAGARGRSFLGDLVRLTYAENTGAFLGLGSRLPASAKTVIFTVLTGLFLAVLLGFIVRRRYRGWAAFGMTLIFAGGVSNWADRASHGRVVDFLNVGLGSVRTGVFNVADIAIVLGVIVVTVTAVRGDRFSGWDPRPNEPTG